MSCHKCAHKTLSLFICSFAKVELAFPLYQSPLSNVQPTRFFTTARRSHRADKALSQPRPYRAGKISSRIRPYRSERTPSELPKAVEEDTPEEDGAQTRNERPSWQLQKAALKEKLGGEAWNPRKKLSPDTMEGIRHLHSTQPDKFTTPILAEHFKVTPEAIRRILKSKWRPSEEEHEARMQRWNKRGERIWTNLVEMGVKPPKQWRDMGVGRATRGERPKWKSLRRNMVDVKDSASDGSLVEERGIIPIVDGSGKARPRKDVPLSERL